MTDNLIKLDKIYSKFFLAACFIFISTVILFDTQLRGISGLSLVFSIARNLTYIITIFKLLLDFIQKKFSISEILFVVIITIFLGIICVTSGLNNLLIYWAFIVAAHDIKTEILIKICFYSHIFSLIAIFGLCFIGILPDNINIRSDGTIRHSLGFFYGGLLSHFVMYTLLLYVYIRQKKIKLVEIVLMAVFSLFIYIATDTKSPFALSIILLVLTFILRSVPLNNKFNNAFKIFSALIGPTSILLITFLSKKYNDSNQILFNLNELLSGRLALGHRAFSEIGISIFGRHVIWDVGSGYNYVDSSYIKAIFDYGIIFGLFLAAILTVIGIKINKKADIWALLCLTIVCIHSMFDDQLLWMGSNSFMLAIYSYIKSRDIENA